MTTVQTILLVVACSVLFYGIGWSHGTQKWTAAISGRAKHFGEYYWVIPDNSETAKRFLATVFSAPYQWVDGTEFPNTKLSSLEILSRLNSVFGSEPTHRFVDTFGWRLSEDRWVTLCTFNTGEYIIQLRNLQNEILASSVSKGYCLKDSANWISYVANVQNQTRAMPPSSHYVCSPQPC